MMSLFSSDLAIDLGTANTCVYARGKGIVVNEPSIVAINKASGEVVAVGKDAKDMLGRTPGNVVAIKPMKDGVIADFKVTEKMLTHFIQKAHNRRVLVHPRIVIGVPSEITPVEKRAVQDSAYRARASEYDEWFYRQNRYDRGEEINKQWFNEAAEVRRALHGIGQVDSALEMAGGTGIWTQELAQLGHRSHESLTRGSITEYNTSVRRLTST